jgi:hypothetical protein
LQRHVAKSRGGQCSAARIGPGLPFQTLGYVGDALIVAFGLDHAGIAFLSVCSWRRAFSWRCRQDFRGAMLLTGF